MKEGDEVKWQGVNNVISGTLLRKSDEPGYWIVKTPTGRVVAVSEKSIIQ